MRHKLRSFTFLFFVSLVSTQNPSKPSLEDAFNDLFSVRQFRETVISPEGSRVAWVEALTEENGAPTANSAIYVADLSSPASPPRRISAAGTGAYSEHDIAWSPDGGRLAFLSDKDRPGQLQLHVAEAAGTPARRLTDLTGFLAAPSWSPDGKRIAFLFTENAPREAGPLVAATPATGVIEETMYEQRLATVDLDTRQVRQLSPPDLYVYEFDWSPDGKTFTATAAHGSGDNNWYIAELYAISSFSGQTRSILKPGMQIAMPKWSPDGKLIAFIGGLMSDEFIAAGDIYSIPAEGGQPRNLTLEMKGSAAWIAWASADRILFVDHVDGQSGIARLNTGNGAIEMLWKGAEMIVRRPFMLGLSLTRDGRTSALLRHSFDKPPEVWAGPIGGWRQITRVNADARPSWGQAKSIHWRSDALQIQGWLVYPRDFDSARRYPMVVEVHGGPSWEHMSAWPETFFTVLLLSAEGYFIFLPNPRGSYGQGEAFTRANVKDFGYGDLRDILAGVDEIVRTLPVDSNRIGITGWSYGGFMTMWAVTQTQRFRAAVAGAGIANWQSYYGQNLIDQWMIPFFGASVYDDPAIYARSSPIQFIKKIKTPTLILVGDRDAECPAPQSQEFWHALKTLGVKTQFVIYPNEGHLIADPEHRRDIFRRSAAWFDAHLR